MVAGVKSSNIDNKIYEWKHTPLSCYTPFAMATASGYGEMCNISIIAVTSDDGRTPCDIICKMEHRIHHQNGLLYEWWIKNRNADIALWLLPPFFFFFFLSFFFSSKLRSECQIGDWSMALFKRSLSVTAKMSWQDPPKTSLQRTWSLERETEKEGETEKERFWWLMWRDGLRRKKGGWGERERERFHWIMWRTDVQKN